MKKIIFSAAVLFAAVAGYNCYNNSSASDDEMSDLMKANIEALASIPTIDCCTYCRGKYCGEFTPVGYVGSYSVYYK